MLFYSLICWETQGVKLHFRCENTSLSQKQGSPLFKLLYRESCQKTNNGGVNLCFCSCTATWFLQEKFNLVTELLWQFCCQLWQWELSQSYKQSLAHFTKCNFNFNPITRSLSNYMKGHLLLNYDHRSWIKCVWQKKGNNYFINNPVGGHLTKRRETLLIIPAQREPLLSSNVFIFNCPEQRLCPGNSTCEKQCWVLLGSFGVQWFIPMRTSQNGQRKSQINIQLNRVLF